MAAHQGTREERPRRAPRAVRCVARHFRTEPMTAAATTYARAAAGCLAAAGLSACGPTSPFDRTESLSEEIQQCAGSTVEGIDIYDGTGSVTWSSVKAAGIDCAII